MIDHIAQAVQCEQVNLLDARSALRRDAQMEIGWLQHRTHLAAIAPRHRNHHHLAIMRCGDSVHHIGRIAAGGDGEQHIAFHAECAYLLGEYLFVIVVVGDGGQHGTIRRQGDCGQARTLDLETVDELCREVLRIASRTAVTAGEYSTMGLAITFLLCSLISALSSKCWLTRLRSVISSLCDES
ncbi:MAG: hypothetical protein FD121_224 [Gallionellaceae bacterium]|nr:MAG: hypothetical protein FD121_224 [Gallionellaceae bacterium]